MGMSGCYVKIDVNNNVYVKPFRLGTWQVPKSALSR